MGFDPSREIVHDDINAVLSRYANRVHAVATLAADLRADIQRFADAINKAGASDRGTDLEITIEIAS
jgi:hypothetical protein